MDWLQALILGIIQGLTEFLPVSSSGHLELGKVILGVEVKESLTFTVVVHGATVLSTIFVFRKDIGKLIWGLLQFKWNEETQYVFKIMLSMIPVGILGVFFKDEIEAFFTGNVLLVGVMLLVTGLLLAFTYYSRQRNKEITWLDSIIIGIAQAVAVMPGISRSGATIATGLLLGNKKDGIAKFSFLMVLIPVIGANLKDVLDGSMTTETIGFLPLAVGFVAAFISGLLACTLMINIVKRGKLIWFAVYCAVVGIAAISWVLFF